MFHNRILAGALDAADVAVQLHDVATAGAPVQAVDVLRDQREIGNAPFEHGKRAMTGIGLRLCDELAPPRVPIPHELGVAAECIRCGELLRIELRPQARLGIAKRRHAGFGGDAGARQHRDAARPGDRAGE